jgi:hypothetical protein
MPRILLIGLSAFALLIASSLVSPAAFSSTAQAAEKQSAKPSKKKGGDPAGIAVSDPGAEGSKPVKGKKH